MGDVDDLYNEGDVEEILEEMAEAGEGEAALYGGDLFGPVTPGSRYCCGDHGPILARKVDWLPDGKPHCPTCGELLTVETDA